jgi:RHS repeat-associated protein
VGLRDARCLACTCGALSPGPDGTGQAQVGSVRQLADADGQVTLAQSFDPFGVLLEADGSGASEFGYTGEQADGSTGLVFLRARYYDPAVGRFLAKDPFPGFAQRPATLHSYAYVTNNPINRADASGYNGGPIAGAAGGSIVSCFGIAFLIPDPLFIEEGVCTLIALGVIVATPIVIDRVLDGGVTVPDVYDGPRPVYPPGQPEPRPAPAPPEAPPIPEDGYVSPDEAQELRELYGRPSAPKPGRTPIPVPFDPRWEPPTPPATCTPDNEYGYEVLTVGDGNFSYSIGLHMRHQDWKITGTNYGNGSNSQNFVSSSGQLSLYTNVDAAKLEIGPVTGQNQYDAIVFNAPRAEGASVQSKGVSGDLVDAVLRSALHVLKPGGQMRFSSSGGMPATPRLQQRVRPGEWPVGYGSAYRGSLYFADPEGFGVPYQPINNQGSPLDVKWDKMYWYVFVK